MYFFRTEQSKAKFGKKKCAACQETQALFSNLKTVPSTHCLNIAYFDMDSIEGLTEGAFHNVSNVPTTILQKKGHTIKRWDGAVPHDALTYLEDSQT